MKTRSNLLDEIRGSGSSHAFSRTELCVALGVLTILAFTLGSSLARPREPGQRVGCVNNLRQLGIALLIYSSENDNLFPPPHYLPGWPARLQPYFHDLLILRCPNDRPDPEFYGIRNMAPADQAPRSYILNGWDDYYVYPISHPAPFPESAIQDPAATILFGEKVTESTHFWYSLIDYWPIYDFYNVEYSRHLRSNPSDLTSGGSNYAMADGNVRFFKWGRAISPINLWAITDLYRNNP